MPEFRPCPGCGVCPGELHDLGCDVERCPVCGGQAISCGCVWDETDERKMPWTGEWPGEAECREYGFYSRWKSDRGWPHEPVGWLRCNKDDEGAGPDLNRLVMECDWDAEQQKFVPRK